MHPTLIVTPAPCACSRFAALLCSDAAIAPASRARLDAGEYHAIAAPSNGPLVAWGAGALGGAAAGAGGAPVVVKGLPRHRGADVVAIAAGFQHSLAVLTVCPERRGEL